MTVTFRARLQISRVWGPGYFHSWHCSLRRIRRARDQIPRLRQPSMYSSSPRTEALAFIIDSFQSRQHTCFDQPKGLPPSPVFSPRSCIRALLTALLNHLRHTPSTVITSPHSIISHPSQPWLPTHKICPRLTPLSAVSHRHKKRKSLHQRRRGPARAPLV